MSLAVLFVALQSRRVQLFITQRFTTFLANNSDLKIHVETVNLSLFGKLVLGNLWLEDQAGDTLASAGQVTLHLGKLNLRHKQGHFDLITIEKARVNIRKDASGEYNFRFLTRRQTPADSLNTNPWTLSCHTFRIRKSEFTYLDQRGNPREYRVDDINLHIGDFYLGPENMNLKISSLTLIDSKGFYLEDLTADITSVADTFHIRNIGFRTLNSVVDSASLVLKQVALPGTGERISDFRLTLPPARLSMKDLALFLPAVKGMNQVFEVSGLFTGNPRNLKARNLLIRTGTNTSVACDLTVSSYEELSEPFIFLDLKRFRTDFRDLSQIRLPSQSKVNYLRFPDNLYQTGTISYEGNFTGFLSDFVAYGTLRSPMGTVKTDLLFAPAGNNRLRFDGKLGTSDFELGKLLRTSQIGEVSLNGMVKGFLNQNGTSLDATFDGVVSSLRAYQYTYHNLLLDGKIENRKFDGNVTLDDPNLKLNFSGVLNLNEKTPEFDFILNLQKADLVALQLDSRSTESDLSFEMTANFSGSSFDSFEGLVQVYNGSYQNQNGQMEFASLTVSTSLNEESSRINLYSDYLDGTITGEYHLGYLPQSFRQVVAAYLPAFAPGAGETPVSIAANKFGFSFDVRNLDELTAVFLPDLKVTGPFAIHGKIDSGDSGLELFGKIPSLTYQDMAFDNLEFRLSPENRKLFSDITLDRAHLANQTDLFNISLEATAGGDIVGTRIGWDNRKKLTYKGEIESEFLFTRMEGRAKPFTDIRVNPATIILADSAWQLSQTSLRIDTTSVNIQGFSFSNGNQKIAINGKISTNPEEQLRIDLQNIGLPSAAYYLGLRDEMKGTFNGSISLSDLYKDRLFRSDLRLDGLEFRNQGIGDVSLFSHWDSETRLMNGELTIEKNGKLELLAKGSMDPRTTHMDFTFDFENQPLVILNTVITDVLTGFYGYGSGKIRLQGTPEKILLDGAVFCRDAGLTVGYTQVTYELNDSVHFAGDKIIFDNIRFRDRQGNRGLFTGTIRHDSFQNMDFDLHLSTGKILAMNTTAKSSEQFYGKVVAAGNITITGHGSDVLLAGEATSLPETAGTIVLSDDAEVTRYDFVRFVSPDTGRVTAPVVARTPPSSGFEMDLLMHVTPDARVQMIYNTQISDLISGQGEGTLRFRMDKAGNIFLSGNLDLTQGEYLFTVQDVINKRFVVEPGGSVTWSGDPYNAVIDLKAVYKLKASLYELMAGTSENAGSNQRVPVECKILLTGDLISPDIGFDIVFPDLEARLRDEMQQFFTTQEDLNRQMLSLLVLGRFYTPEYIRGNYEPTTGSLIGSTASDLFSNQLSNWLSRINKDVDVGFNYRPGNQITGDEIELALSTQIFNDRVTINGNIANNTNPTSMNNSELVGDFEINVKLTPSGKLQLKAYNRSNNNLIYETAPYTQGLGLSYKENFDTTREFWQKFLTLFRKPGKRAEPAATP